MAMRRMALAALLAHLGGAAAMEAAVAGLAPSARTPESVLLDAALPADDECLAMLGSSGGDLDRGALQTQCALSALQVRAAKRVHEEEEKEGTSRGIGTEVGASGATAATSASQEAQRKATILAWQALGSEGLPVVPDWNREKLSQGLSLPFNVKHEATMSTGPWHGGGLVDGLNGEEQVEIMRARDKDFHIGRIVYQVFVDRFVPPKDLESKRKFHAPPQTLHNWSQPVFAGTLNPETGYWTNELAYWGGDLDGVRSKLDYIKEFADILYLQPIFKAYSSHKYDTSDYFEIDEGYGTLEDFNDLVAEVHGRGMKLVLDGVFNHVGIRSKVFQEALADPHSKQRPWFFIGGEWARGFKTWQDGNTLAEFRLENKQLQEYIWNSSDSVIATWLARGADGWRLDVGTEIGREFLWDITKSAHRYKYGSLVVGEVSAYPRWWTEALDGILSFWMGWVINGVVSGKMGGVFAGMQIQDLIKESSMEQVLRSWIVVSNHDLPRLSAKYPDPNLRKFAMTLQFALPGAVCLYYGEELGMEGEGDPFNRGPMQWDMVNADNDILNHTRMLVALRRRARALRIGDFHALRSFSLLAFLRRTDRIDDIVIVLANPTDNAVEELVSIPVEDILEFTLFRDPLSGEEVRIRGGTCTMKVPPHTARVLEMVNEKGPNGEQYKRIYGHWNTFADVDAASAMGNSVGDYIVDPAFRAHRRVRRQGSVPA